MLWSQNVFSMPRLRSSGGLWVGDKGLSIECVHELEEELSDKVVLAFVFLVKNKALKSKIVQGFDLCCKAKELLMKGILFWLKFTSVRTHAEHLYSRQLLRINW